MHFKMFFKIQLHSHPSENCASYPQRNERNLNRRTQEFYTWISTTRQNTAALRTETHSDVRGISVMPQYVLTQTWSHLFSQTMANIEMLWDKWLAPSTARFPDSKSDSTAGVDTDVLSTSTGAYMWSNLKSGPYFGTLTSNRPLPPLPNHSHASREFPLAGTLPAPALEPAE